MRTAKLICAVVMLGATVSCACTAQPGNRPGIRVVAYPLNRVLDLLDVFSVGFGVGYGMEVHCTRALQLGYMEVPACPLVGWWPRRELATQFGGRAEISFGPWSGKELKYKRMGTRGTREVDIEQAGLDEPTDPIYRELDYWGIGAAAYAFFMGAEFELHPVEVADLVCGLLFIDFMWDDVGHRRAQ